MYILNECPPACPAKARSQTRERVFFVTKGAAVRRVKDCAKGSETPRTESPLATLILESNLDGETTAQESPHSFTFACPPGGGRK